MTTEYIGTKQVTAWPQEKDGKPGYAVKYQDGYVSWSPKDQFEAAYIEIGHINHLPAHVQRMIGERAQLVDKMNKLSAFIGTPNFAQLSQPERHRLEAQYSCMNEYARILGDRIEAATTN